MNNKKKIITGILIFTVVLIVITGLSYAYFSANIEGNETEDTITVVGGRMNIHYNDSNPNIIASNITPKNEPFATKTFTVTGNNTMDINMYYEVKLVVEENTFSEGALKYKLRGTNTDNNGFLIEDPTELTNIGSGSNTISLGVGGYDVPTGGNKVHTYNLELYFPDTGINQNQDQGKSFKAYVKINGADEPICEECLNNKLLAQDGGLSAIENRSIPDFNAISPSILTYKEASATYTNSISSSANRAVGTGYTFNETTGNYTLINYQTGQTYRPEHIGQYTCNSSSYLNCNIMYKINAVTGTRVTNSIRYSNEINEYNYSDTGLHAVEDDYGTSYYYRGDKEKLNNNLIWGGFQWKIVRINGDGSIRIVYNGTETEFNSSGSMTSAGSNTEITITSWNQTHADDAKYVGYMYGGANGTTSTMRYGSTSAAATYNETSTNMKTTLDNWYKTNIIDKGYSEMVVDNLFCNDRQLQSEAGGSSTGLGYGNIGETTYYGAYQRIINNKTPTLKCGSQNDRFTVNDKTLGNGALTYPIGLLTGDEITFAGFINGITNSPNYLYTNSSFWLFSPFSMYPNDSATIMYVGSYGGVYEGYVDSLKGVRPVVSLSPSVVPTGTGSSTDPFRV